MKAAVVSRYKTQRIKKILKKHGFKIISINPDFVLCYGGDGTILFSEMKFPGIPKISIKVSESFCRTYDYRVQVLEKILERIKKKKYKVRKMMKLEAKYKKHKVEAMNELQIRCSSPIKALRFSVSVDKKKFNSLIGDGAIISTPYGSTGYYRSTGGKPFKKGIGIAFNNLFKPRIKRSFVVSEKSKIKIKIERGGLLLRDNDEKFIRLKKNDSVLVGKSKDTAKFVEIK